MLLFFIIFSFFVITGFYAFKMYKNIKAVEKLDILCNFHKTSKQKNQIHWFKGHQVQYPANSDGLENILMGKLLDFPHAFNYHIAPGFSMLQLYHPSTVIYFANCSAPKDPLSYGLLEPWLGKGLLTSNGDYWFRHRRMITPAFHFNILKSYISIFNSSVETFLNKLDSFGEKPVEIFKHVRLLTMDTMLQCAMSSQTDCQTTGNQSAYVSSVRKLLYITLKRLLDPLLISDWIFWLSPDGREYKKSLKIVHRHTENIIKQRKRKLSLAPSESNSNSDMSSDDGSKKKLFDFIDLLLQAKDVDGKPLSDLEIREEVDTFLFEGHDTTSSGISWALYNLASNPDVQEKCRQELNDVVGRKNIISWGDLAKLEYLGMCIKENMRLYPPVIDIGRKADSPINVDTQQCKGTIAAGTTVVLSIFQLHRNPALWPEPNKFDPERFTKENISKRSPFAYLPFSAGTRNCIGQNFATNEMKVVLGQILRRYQLVCDNECPEPRMKPAFILESENGIHIKFKPL